MVLKVVNHLSEAPYHYLEELSKQYIQKLQRRWKKNSLKKYEFFIEPKEEGKMIGCLGVTKGKFDIWTTG